MTPTKRKRSLDEYLDDLADRTLRGDIATIVRNAVLDTLKERERRKCVEVGYRG